MTTVEEICHALPASRGAICPQAIENTLKSRARPTGVIVANDKPDGAVGTGDFQLAEPSAAERERRRNLT